MIPAQFEYHRPDSVAAAVDLMREHGDEGRVVAGGHSLIPMMKLRMAAPEHLIDLQGIADLKGIEVGETIRIGAMTTQSEMLIHTGLADAAPILLEAARQIADPQVRNLGTVGGNVANGDPGNDLPALMMCLDARFTLVGPDGTREVAARDFYEAPYVTAREEEELLTAVSFAAPPRGHAYEKQKRKIGDYATAAAAVLIGAEDGRVVSASVAMTNVADVPVHSTAAGEALIGTACGEDAVQAAVAAMQGDIDPVEDNRGPVEFKRHVAGVILARAIARAWDRA
ncbi:carbon monoxide dehydrogenase, medium subunit [Rhodovulum sp. ES.010]|uniref:FAD binding domain-containing protein n=1 Tax=Rhodovulum sp. ES.010 TaxID=1882821 RepID=UPI0009292B8A|nr:xanthine dehydrogenase family protein subunit M [Rhodovulum sp. ES.010]SIO41363.1 carbon monoxide dehydrogenase, medium subunit [Rhodovulum sp. ES.010]